MSATVQLLLAIATFCGGSGSDHTKECTVRVLDCYKETVKVISPDESLLTCLKKEAARFTL